MEAESGRINTADKVWLCKPRRSSSQPSAMEEHLERQLRQTIQPIEGQVGGWIKTVNDENGTVLRGQLSICFELL